VNHKVHVQWFISQLKLSRRFLSTVHHVTDSLRGGVYLLKRIVGHSSMIQHMKSLWIILSIVMTLFLLVLTASLSLSLIGSVRPSHLSMRTSDWFNKSHVCPASCPYGQFRLSVAYECRSWLSCLEIAKIDVIGELGSGAVKMVGKKIIVWYILSSSSLKYNVMRTQSVKDHTLSIALRECLTFPIICQNDV